MRCGGESSSANQISVFVTSFGLSNQNRSMKCDAQNDRFEKVTATSIIGGKISNLTLVFLPADEEAAGSINNLFHRSKGEGTVTNLT